MKKILAVLAALWIAGSGWALAGKIDSRGLGDMRWGDSERKVSERYASRYIEDTAAGGRLVAVNFSDFKEEMGIRGPLTVLAAFEQDRLVQINVPLMADSEADAAKAFAAYTAAAADRYGAPREKDGDSALWVGDHTNIYVQKRPEGIIVSLIDSRFMEKFWKK